MKHLAPASLYVSDIVVVIKMSGQPAFLLTVLARRDAGETFKFTNEMCLVVVHALITDTSKAVVTLVHQVQCLYITFIVNHCFG